MFSPATVDAIQGQKESEMRGLFAIPLTGGRYAMTRLGAGAFALALILAWKGRTG